MIDPITFEIGGTAMPLFSFVDTSELVPLELPPAMATLARPANSEHIIKVNAENYIRCRFTEFIHYGPDNAV